MHPIEREIVAEIVNAILSDTAKTITVYDGEETVLTKSDNAKNILESIGHTDHDCLYWNSDDDTGMVMPVYGNEPEYVVADYSSDETTAKIVESITDKYEA